MNPLGSRERGSDGVAAAAAVLAIFTVAGKLGTFAQESAIAALFGASRNVDLLISGRLVPSFVAGVLGVTVGITIIPIVQRLQRECEVARIRAMLQTSIATIAGVMVCGLLASVLLRYYLFRAIAPGYTTGERHILSQITSAAFLLATLDTCGLLLVAVLHAQRRFRAGALASLVGSAFGLLAVILLGARLGIWGVVVGWGLGSATQLGLLIWLLRREVIGTVRGWKECWAGSTRVAKNGVPILLLAVVANVVTFADRGIASTLEVGSVALINWAQKVYNLPIGLAVVPLATAVYPFLTGVPAGEQVRSRVRLSISATVFLLIPACLVLVLLREQISTLFFQRGAFSGSDASRLSDVLAGYGVGLLFIGGFSVLVRVAYGLGQLWAPLLASAIGSALYVPLGLFLSHRYGVTGLAIAYSTVMLLSCTVLAFRIWSAHRDAISLALGRELTTFVVAGAGMGVMILGLGSGLRAFTTERWGDALAVTVFPALGIASYWVVCHVLGSDVQRRVLREVRRVVAVRG